MMMEAVRMESGGLDDERGSALNKQKGDEIKKLDLKTMVDQMKEGIRQLKKKKEDYEDERKVVEKFLERYRVEEVEKRRREDDDNDGNNRQQKKEKIVGISRTLPNTLELYEDIFFLF